MSVADHFMLCPESPSYVAWARDSPPGRGGKVKRGDFVVSKVAGYYSVRTQGVTYRMHRVVYELTHGYCPERIDHIDRDRGNNHPDNLRPITHTANLWNSTLRTDNKSGVKGLRWHERSKRWVGKVTANRAVHTMRSEDMEAVETWLAAKRLELHGSFASGG